MVRTGARQKIFEFLQDVDTANFTDIHSLVRSKFPEIPRGTISSTLYSWRKVHNQNIKQRVKKNKGNVNLLSIDLEKAIDD